MGRERDLAIADARMTDLPQPLDVTQGTDASRVTKLRWGILGASNIASDWCKSLRDVEGAEVTAIAARSLERVTAWADTHGVPQRYTDYAELCASDSVDIVYVSTITKLHKDHAILALTHGKHVLVEKPLAPTAAEAREIVELAKRKGLFLQECMWTRFMPAIEKARSLIAEGAIGRPTAVHADFGFNALSFEPDSGMFLPGPGSGGMLAVGCYVVQAAPMVFGSAEPVRLAAAGTMNESGVDLSGGISLQYGSDQLAVLAYNLTAETNELTEISGTKGRIRIHSPAHCSEGLTLMESIDRGKNNCTDFSYPIPEPKGYPAEGWHYPNQHGFVYLAQAVHRCIGAGRRECPQYPLDESLLVLSLMDEAKAQIASTAQTQRKRHR